MDSILAKVEYKGKSIWEKGADFVLMPARTLFHGRRIECFKADDAGHAGQSDKTVEFRVNNPTVKSQKGFRRARHHHISTIYLTVILAPFWILAAPFALLIKSGCSNRKALLKRLEKIETTPSKTGDYVIQRNQTYKTAKVYKRALLLQKNYSPIKESTHIQFDKYIASDERFRKFEGGYAYHSARMMRRRLEPYRQDPDLGAAVRPLAKMIQEYEEWNYVLYPIIGARDPQAKAPPVRRVNRAVSDLKRRTGELRPGEAFLIPIRFKPKDSKGGHIVVGEFRRTDDGTADPPRLRFTLFNDGWGSQPHHARPHAMKGFFGERRIDVAPWTIENLKLDQLDQPIGDTTFLETVVNVATCEQEDTGTDSYDRLAAAAHALNALEHPELAAQPGADKEPATSPSIPEQMSTFFGNLFGLENMRDSENAKRLEPEIPDRIQVNPDPDWSAIAVRPCHREGLCIWKSLLHAVKANIRTAEGELDEETYKILMHRMKIDDLKRLHHQFPKSTEEDAKGDAALAHRIWTDAGPDVAKRIERFHGSARQRALEALDEETREIFQAHHIELPKT